MGWLRGVRCARSETLNPSPAPRPPSADDHPIACGSPLQRLRSRLPPSSRATRLLCCRLFAPPQTFCPSPSFPPWSQQHPRDRRRKEIGEGSGQHRPNSELSQIALSLGNQGSNSSELNSHRAEVGEPGQRK